MQVLADLGTPSEPHIDFDVKWVDRSIDVEIDCQQWGRLPIPSFQQFFVKIQGMFGMSLFLLKLKTETKITVAK